MITAVLRIAKLLMECPNRTKLSIFNLSFETA